MQAQDEDLPVPRQGTPVINRIYGIPIIAMVIDDLVHPIDVLLDDMPKRELAQLIEAMQPTEIYAVPGPLKYHERFNTGRIPKFNSTRQRHRR